MKHWWISYTYTRCNNDEHRNKSYLKRAKIKSDEKAMKTIRKSNLSLSSPKDVSREKQISGAKY